MAQALGNLFIIAAPSGAGKSSLIKAILEAQQTLTDSSLKMQVSVSHTTRQPRPGEVNGEHYHFVDIATFEQMINEGEFYEHAKVFNNYYGTSKRAIQKTLLRGIDVFLDIDWQGARQVKLLTPDAVGIFILPPSLNALELRLVGRAQDSKETIASRMEQATAEMSHVNEFDYVIINDDFSCAHKELAAIITAEKCTFANQLLRHKSLIDSLTQ